MKILLKKLSRKEFRERNKDMPKDTGAVTQSRKRNGRQWRIQINKDLPSKTYKRILKHEEGHVFSEKRKIVKKLSREQKEMLVKYYGTSLAPRKSSQAKLQEAIAELYRIHRYHKKTDIAKEFKKMAPKTSKIINTEIKKFKPEYTST